MPGSAKRLHERDWLMRYDESMAGSGHDEQERQWIAEFEANRRRPLEQRFRYAFIRTYKPVLDDARFRSFDTLAEYRRWCEENLPSWLGYGRKL